MSMQFRARYLRSLVATLLLAAYLLMGCAPGAGAGLRPFSSDGCTLFPDGTPGNRNQWCACCLNHDLAYWQGGSKAKRLAADATLYDCVQEQTGDALLAQIMYLGARAGGSPALPTWYRWGYGWEFGRGYQSLSATEKERVTELLAAYEAHPHGYCGSDDQPGGGRPATWAEPVPTEHLNNFYRLDARVYRAAQPNAAAFAELKARGIVNILNLRDSHADEPEDAAGLHLFRVGMAAESVTTGQVIAALRIINQSDGPILIHCRHGADRTGLVSAMYRIVFQGWEKEAAIAELTDGGYGFHAFFYPNIPEFIRQADSAAIRAAVLAP